jgi:uncharacterized protein
MSRDTRKLLAVGGINGATERLTTLLEELSDAPVAAVAVVGDLGAAWSKADTYRAIFKALGRLDLPAFWVPGQVDAPLSDYLRESYNMETVFPHLHGVHGTVALGPGQLLFAGMGGEIVDDPAAVRSEEALLRYPAWEVEYRLKMIHQLKEHPKVFLFTTRPAHKGLREQGSEALAELIKTHNPRLVVVSGEGAAEEKLAQSIVISPGRLDQGQYSLVDLREFSVEVGTLAEHAAV